MLIKHFTVALCMIVATQATAESSLESAMQEYQAGRLTRAQAAVQTFLSAQPRDPNGRLLLADILIKQNRISDALKLLQSLIAEYPKLPLPQTTLGWAYLAKGDTERAKSQLEKVVREFPDFVDGPENLADLYLILAERQYATALAKDPSNQTVQLRRFKLLSLLVATRAQSFTTNEALDSINPTPLTAAQIAEADIWATIEQWREAWRQKNLTAYFATYAKSFQPSDGKRREEWMNLRGKRITQAGDIELTLDKFEITLTGQRATVKFNQRYQSGKLRDYAVKTLELMQEGGKWLIVRESSSPLVSAL